MTLDEQIEEKQKELNDLKALKHKESAQEIVDSLEENRYYEIWHVEPDTTIYFKYTKSNLVLRDGTGTVGYNNTSYITINNCLYQTFHRFSGEGGYKSCYHFNAEILNPKSISPCKITEISEEKFRNIQDEILKEIKDDEPELQITHEDIECSYRRIFYARKDSASEWEGFEIKSEEAKKKWHENHKDWNMYVILDEGHNLSWPNVSIKEYK